MNTTTLNSRTSVLTHPVALSVYGALVIVALTQIRIPLPFTPVPITGQTFAVILWPLLFGRNVGLGSIGLYLGAGALGLPVFAGFAALTALWGPTSGYLIGFVLAGALVGGLRDRGVTTSLVGSTLTIVGAIALILASGALVLGQFVGYNNVWMMGVAPFLIGDVVKTVLLLGTSRASTWKTQS
ncbi:MAG: biotin transporter BioY [Candidatus Kapabacteria bacterium]|nr:biotin transporter BioY [Candidatus Kapabacteria bacterium]